ncbi:MAG: (Fe-S)-binding protein [Gammaproteobacteria bacterium]|nr:(Fe-S)-binding protein [Gammaproteobacteria bacterium]
MNSSQQSISADADLCVKCGLCLPHCPTYGMTRDEGDSPRGRIALIQALAEGALPPGGRLEFHLDRCLSCRACERVCPSRVPYGRLIEAGRSLGTSPHLRQGTRLLADGWLVRFAPLLHLYQRSGLQWLARGARLPSLAGLGRLDRILPPVPLRTGLKPRYPVAAARGSVALFTGCMGRALEREALLDSIRLLNACGYTVEIPTAQGCCGAMHRHAGDREGARELARRNIEVFNALEVDAVAHVASGCGAALAEYEAWASADDAELPAFRARPVDICTLLEQCGIADRVSFRPMSGRVLVHEPCSLRNVLRAEAAPYRLLRRIPGLEVEALAGNERCCGGAGTYMIDQPEMADALRSPKIAAIRESKASIVLTSNTGCAMHLAEGLRKAGSETAVMHVVSLLEQQRTEES